MGAVFNLLLKFRWEKKLFASSLLCCTIFSSTSILMSTIHYSVCQFVFMSCVILHGMSWFKNNNPPLPPTSPLFRQTTTFGSTGIFILGLTETETDKLAYRQTDRDRQTETSGSLSDWSSTAVAYAGFHSGVGEIWCGGSKKLTSLSCSRQSLAAKCIPIHSEVKKMRVIKRMQTLKKWYQQKWRHITFVVKFFSYPRWGFKPNLVGFFGYTHLKNPPPKTHTSTLT